MIKKSLCLLLTITALTEGQLLQNPPSVTAISTTNQAGNGYGGPASGGMGANGAGGSAVGGNGIGGSINHSTFITNTVNSRNGLLRGNNSPSSTFITTDNIAGSGYGGPAYGAPAYGNGLPLLYNTNQGGNAIGGAGIGGSIQSYTDVYQSNTGSNSLFGRNNSPSMTSIQTTNVAGNGYGGPAYGAPAYGNGLFSPSIGGSSVGGMGIGGSIDSVVMSRMNNRRLDEEQYDRDLIFYPNSVPTGSYIETTNVAGNGYGGAATGGAAYGSGNVVGGTAIGGNGYGGSISASQNVVGNKDSRNDGLFRLRGSNGSDLTNINTTNVAGNGYGGAATGGAASGTGFGNVVGGTAVGGNGYGGSISNEVHVDNRNRASSSSVGRLLESLMPVQVQRDPRTTIVNTNNVAGDGYGGAANAGPTYNSIFGMPVHGGDAIGGNGVGGNINSVVESINARTTGLFNSIFN